MNKHHYLTWDNYGECIHYSTKSEIEKYAKALKVLDEKGQEQLTIMGYDLEVNILYYVDKGNFYKFSDYFNKIRKEFEDLVAIRDGIVDTMEDFYE